MLAFIQVVDLEEAKNLPSKYTLETFVNYMYIKVINGLPMTCIVFRLLPHLLIKKIKKETNKQQQQQQQKKEKIVSVTEINSGLFFLYTLPDITTLKRISYSLKFQFKFPVNPVNFHLTAGRLEINFEQLTTLIRQ